MTPAADIYSFGICALEMAALEIQGNGDSGNVVTEENIARTIDSLEDEQQKDFIRKCLLENPSSRPKARELLFHPLLFEVHSLKLLAAHCLVKNSGKYMAKCSNPRGVAQFFKGEKIKQVFFWKDSKTVGPIL